MKYFTKSFLYYQQGSKSLKNISAKMPGKVEKHEDYLVQICFVRTLSRYIGITVLNDMFEWL